jgi:hypothetical protein
LKIGLSLIQYPDPGIFKLAGAFTGILRSIEGKYAVHPLLAVIEVSTLSGTVDIECELFILCDEYHLIGCSISLIDSIRELCFGGSIFKSTELKELDFPGG